MWLNIFSAQHELALTVFTSLAAWDCPSCLDLEWTTVFVFAFDICWRLLSSGCHPSVFDPVAFVSCPFAALSAAFDSLREWWFGNLVPALPTVTPLSSALRTIVLVLLPSLQRNFTERFIPTSVVLSRPSSLRNDWSLLCTRQYCGVGPVYPCSACSCGVGWCLRCGLLRFDLLAFNGPYGPNSSCVRLADMCSPMPLDLIEN